MNEEKPFRVEEVDEVAPPPKARVEDAEAAGDKLARKRDYLEGFLAEKPQEHALLARRVGGLRALSQVGG